MACRNGYNCNPCILPCSLHIPAQLAENIKNSNVEKVETFFPKRDKAE